MAVQDRYYKRKEYDQMSPKARKKLKTLRDARGGGKGGNSKDPNVDKVTIKSLLAACSALSSIAALFSDARAPDQSTNGGDTHCNRIAVPDGIELRTLPCFVLCWLTLLLCALC